MVKTAHGDSNILLLPAGVYVENPDHKMSRSFLPKEVYAPAIASFVIVCTDAVIVDRSRRTIILVRRKVKPMQGWWIVGGRRFAGESVQDSMVRCFHRETGLMLPADRFALVNINEYLWQDREQQPQNLGSHNLAHTFAVELDTAERTDIRLDSAEFEKVLGEFDEARLTREGVHPSLVDLYQQIFSPSAV